jgi:uncharacterized protein
LSKKKAETAYFAALIHDLGHGPFSHAFESALDQAGRHEKYTEELVRGHDISPILEKYRKGLTEEVAAIFKSETSPDIYSSIVSSQFDADRLDYMRRDRLMAGIHGYGIDLTWLIRNLDFHSIEIGIDDKEFAVVDTFVLGEKTGLVGEAYVTALFHLYPTIYLHKTTRGAEKLFGAFLKAMNRAVTQGDIKVTGLDTQHPLIKYLGDKSLANYIELDDSLIWGCLSQAAQASDQEIALCANRLRHRQLLKAIDVRRELSDGRFYPGDEMEQRQLRFRRSLEGKIKADPSLC